MLPKIGPALIGIIKPRAYRGVDGNAAIGDDPRSMRTHAIATGAIDPGHAAKRLFDRAPQPFELRPFERGRQVAGIAVVDIDVFFMRRADPGVQLDPDFRAPMQHRRAQHVGYPRVAGDRIINQVDRRDADVFAKRLEPAEPGNMRQPVAKAVERLGPVKFLFGIDRHDKARAKARCKLHKIVGPRDGADIRVAVQLGQSRPLVRVHGAIFAMMRIFATGTQPPATVALCG